MLVYNILPSGNLPCLLKMAIEIVDLPTKNGDFQQLCKRLPEGKWSFPVMKPLKITDFLWKLWKMMGILGWLYIYGNWGFYQAQMETWPANGDLTNRNEKTWVTNKWRFPDMGLVDFNVIWVGCHWVTKSSVLIGVSTINQPFWGSPYGWTPPNGEFNQQKLGILNEHLWYLNKQQN